MNNLHVWTVWSSNLEEETYGEHIAKWAANHERVYWGVFHGEEYPVKHRFDLDPYLPKLNEQISSGQNTYLFIETLDSLKQYFWGKIADGIKRGADFQGWKKSKLVPTYYKTVVAQRPGLSIDYWILLSEICTIPHDIYRKANPFIKPNTREYGKSRRPYPIICDFDAEDELAKYLEYRKLQSLGKNVEFSHAPDYRSINLHGAPYSITTNQAFVVELLHKAWLNGTPDVSGDYILERLASKNSKLKDIFRSRKEIMKKIVVPGKTKGTYRLNIKNTPQIPQLPSK
jgi:hypothetical protein